MNRRLRRALRTRRFRRWLWLTDQHAERWDRWQEAIAADPNNAVNVPPDDVPEVPVGPSILRGIYHRWWALDTMQRLMAGR